MEPYIKKNSPLRGANRPKTPHGPGNPRVREKARNEVLATKRALKKSARREGKVDPRDY